MIYLDSAASTYFLKKMDPNPPISKAAKFLLYLAGIGMVVGLIGGICFAMWRVKLGRSVKAEVAAIRTNGLPVDMADLERWPAVVPDEQNAALVLNQAWGMLGPTNRERLFALRLPVRGGVLSNRTEMAAVVVTNAAAMELVYGVTNAANSRYPINYLDGPNARLPHLAGLKSLAQVFALGAVLKADQNDPRGAFKDVVSSQKLSRSLDNEPILISQLVSAAILTMTTESLERVLARVALPDGELLELENGFREAEATNKFWMALVGERATDGEMLRMLQEDPRAFIIMANKMSSPDEQTKVPVRNPGVGWKAIGFFERDREYFLRAMEENITALAKGPPVSLSYTNKLDAIETEARAGWHLMSSMFLPSFSKVVRRDADMRARLRTAATAIAVERWRVAHGGQVPDSLDGLVPSFLPSIPIDPFDGKSLRFKKLAKGYVIYSVGPNGEDDGGKERPLSFGKISAEERNRFDITFIVDR
jgi:hypothetical protein